MKFFVFLHLFIAEKVNSLFCSVITVFDNSLVIHLSLQFFLGYIPSTYFWIWNLQGEMPFCKEFALKSLVSSRWNLQVRQTMHAPCSTSVRVNDVLNWSRYFSLIQAWYFSLTLSACFLANFSSPSFLLWLDR